MVTYNEHITWSRPVYVRTFGLQLAGSDTFSLILVFIVSSKCNIDSLLKESILYKQHVDNSSKKKAQQTCHIVMACIHIQMAK